VEDIVDAPPNIIVAHLGSIEESIFSEARIFSEVVESILEILTPELLIITEWGEELQGLRVLLSSTLDRIFPDTKVVPGDIDLSLVINSKKPSIFCCHCKNDVPADQIVSHLTFDDFQEEKIIYLCYDCVPRYSSIIKELRNN
jgi:hypothetical protein